MSVTLSPSSQLGFQRPLTTLVKRTLSVSNHNSSAIAYKVKTTAPKQYCVRPNSGRIEPGETVEVQVLLQPMKEDPPSGTKCRDKFLVQSVVITNQHEGVPLTELWQLVEKDKDSVHEQKIRCTYLPAVDETNSSIPEESPSKFDGANQTTNQPDASFVSTINPNQSTVSSSPARSSPPPSTSASSNSTVAAAPREASAAGGEHLDFASGPPPAIATGYYTSTPPPESAAPSTSRNLPTTNTTSSTSPPSSSTTTNNATTTAKEYAETAKEKAGQAAGIAGTAVAGAAVAAASGLTGMATSIDGGKAKEGELERLKRELKEAKDEVSRLKNELSSSSGGLRNRGANATSSSSSSTTVEKREMGGSKVVEMQGGEGVPVQMVAGIAFAVFLFTWLFL